VEPNTRGMERALQLPLREVLSLDDSAPSGVQLSTGSKDRAPCGMGIYSGPQLFMNEEGYSNQGFGFNQVFLTSPSYGISAGQLSNGIPYTPAAITATHFDPGAYPNVGQPTRPQITSFPTTAVRHVSSRPPLALSVRSQTICRSMCPIIEPRCLAQFRRADEYDQRTPPSVLLRKNTV
jgi:hypothetical protein